MPFEAVTPVGRIVQGNPLVGFHNKDDKTKQPLFNADGTPDLTYMVSLAIDKNNPEWADLYGKIWNEGRAAFPHLFDPASGQCLHRDFSWKIVDGDGRDNSGKLNSEKQGFAGHMILKISSKFPMRCYNQQNQEILEDGHLYRGCFARVAISVKGNGATGTTVPGVYINPQGVQFVGHGERITSGPDAATLFAQPATAGYVPPGMSATPLAGHAPMPQAPGMQPMAPAPGMQPMAPAPGMQPMAPAPGMQPMAPAPAPGMQPMAPAPAPAPGMQPMAPAPGMQVATPNHQFVANAIAPAVPQYAMTAAAQGYTREQWHANGYDDAALLQHGLMVQVG